MPEDRLFHPRLMLSRKVTRLTAFEQVVWRDMILLADDFGVLIDRPARLRGNDDFLAGHTEESVGAGMRTVVTVGLYLGFEHQGQPFLCDPTWQNYQKIEHPRRTYLPMPTPDVMRQCTDDTIYLFARYHPAVASFSVPKLLEDARRKLSERLRKVQKGSRARTPLHTRLTANGQRLTANGVVEEGGSGGKGSRGPLSDEAFVSALKANPAYQGIDVDIELAKMDAWLLTPKARGKKKSRGFIVNWLNRTDRAVAAEPMPLFGPKTSGLPGAVREAARIRGLLPKEGA